jgi:hypothetical protein
MPVVEQLDVRQLEQNPERVLEASIDLPESGGVSETYAVKVAGWVLGQQVTVKGVRAVWSDRIIRATSAHWPHPGVAARFPHIDGASHCGFTMLVDVLGLEPRFEFQLQAVLSDQTSIPLAVVRGRRRLLHSTFEPRLQPLIVNSLGRTGTTWLMHLLGQHPAVVVYRRYPYEVHAARYWMHMLKVLLAPADESKPVGQPDQFHREKASIGGNPFYAVSFPAYPQIEAWYGSIYPERLAAFCQQNIDDWYVRVAASQEQPTAVYFAEKHLPVEYPRLMWELYGGAREIILVRNFKDVASSILAFNSQRGFESFGRTGGESDAAFIQRLRFGAERLLEDWRSRSERAHLVRYEDLVTAPVGTLQPLLEYLHLDATPRTVDGMIQRASENMNQLHQHQTSESPAASIGRWRRDLDPALRTMASEAFDDLLVEFGYQPGA